MLLDCSTWLKAAAQLAVLMSVGVSVCRKNGAGHAGMQAVICLANAANMYRTCLNGRLMQCMRCMQALLHRAATGKPMSILKYAMTLDGKIATNMGHAAWVSCAESRSRVFATRACSDAVIVGGNTVRRDNPSLTTRRDGGHKPVRIVMSRTLDLPAVSCLYAKHA